MLRRLLLAVAVLLSLGLAALAQSGGEGGPDYDAWERVAGRAETALENPDTTDSALETLRADLVAWRTRLLEAENVNATRIETIRGQIDALGPAPDSAAGETEPDAVATRRTELEARLAEAQAPRIAATEAYNRANGLIAEIDETLNRRTARALFETAPIPLNPEHWPAALEALVATSSKVVSEITTAVTTESRWNEIVRRSPLTLALVVLGLTLLVRGRHWMTRLTDWVQQHRQRYGRIALGFLISITQVLIPASGMALLIGAILPLGLTGPVGTAFLRSLLSVVTLIYATLWIANRVFVPDDSLPTVFGLPLAVRRALRRNAIWMGAMLSAFVLLGTLAELEDITPAVIAVLELPAFLLLGWVLFRFSRLMLRGLAETADDPDSTAGFAHWMLVLLARAIMVLAIAAPIAAGLGYVNLAEGAILPAVYSLGLFGLFVALQWPIRDVYCWITRTKLDQAGEALIPVLINFALALGTLPLLALIWGMRPAQLGEIYARFAEGIALGETRVTPGVILTVVLVFALGFMLTRLFQSALKVTVLPRTRMEVGARHALTSFVGYVGIGLSVVAAITTGGIDLTALAVVFGALSVGIGFGLQNIVQNFIAGIILLVERPISEGDWIEVAGNMGIVKDISVRSTTIETFDKQQMIVPNADFISGTVTNWTRGNQIGRAMVDVGVAYGTDTRRVAAILGEIAHEHPAVAAFPEPGVDFMGFGASSLDFRIRMILRDVNKLLDVQTEVRHRIAERFAEEGIEIPFAQQDVWIRNPEAFRGAGQRAGASDPADPATEGADAPGPGAADAQGG